MLCCFARDSDQVIRQVLTALNTVIKKVNGNLENYESWDSDTFKWKSNNRSWFSWLTPPLNSITILFFVLAVGPCFLKYILSCISQNRTFFQCSLIVKKKSTIFVYLSQNPSSQTAGTVLFLWSKETIYEEFNFSLIQPTKLIFSLQLLWRSVFSCHHSGPKHQA